MSPTLALASLAVLYIAWFAFSARSAPYTMRIRYFLTHLNSELGSLTYTTAAAVLKEDYKEPLREQINQSHFILTQIEKNTEDVVGLRAKLALHVKRSTGIGSRAEGDDLPTAGQQGYANTLVPLRFHYGRIQISGPIIKAMSKDRGAFTQAVKSETDGIKKDLMRDVNRQCWGTSNGVIVACGTTSASTTVVLAATATDTQIRQAYADGGMLADIGTVADPDLRTATPVTVTGFSLSAKTLTVSAAVTTATTDFVFRWDNGGASDGSGSPGGADGQRELTGLQNIIDDDSVLFTLDPATQPTWAATVDSNSGTLRPVSENLVTRAIQNAEIASGSQIDLLVGSAGVSRAVANLMQSMRRNIDTVELKAGYSGIRWSAPGEGMGKTKPTALVWDRDAPENHLFGISTDDLVEFVGSDWDWMDDDGAILNRVPNKDAYEATLYKYNELATSQRNAFFDIRDLTAA